jgi:fumarate reductase flavoprotein subunit
MFREHIGPSPERVLQRGAGTGRGDALRMAVEAGAATTRLDRFYGHVLSRDAFHNDALWPYPQVDALGAAGLVVGPDGRRLFDEGLGGIHASNHLATLADPACATVIVDAAIWNGPGRAGLVAPNPGLERHRATIHRAADVATLAKACGIAADALQATVNEYNGALERGELARLSPPRTQRKARAMPIVHAPLMAIPICSGITNTMGGIAIGGNAQVRDRAGKPIAGLYAAGACTGGLEGGPNVDYVGGLIKASVFGLRAADHAAAVHANAMEEVH